MPARTSTRSTRTSTATTKSNSRTSATTRASASEEHADTPDSPLRTQISSIFRDAQRTTATHRKLAINLRKIHEGCCYEPTSRNKTSTSDLDEESFNHEFIRCVLRIMPVKKVESVGEKSIKFIGFFLKLASDKDLELVDNDVADGEAMPETPSTRLISQLLQAIIPLMTAKDKVVRYRSTQLVSHIVNCLDAIDDDVFQAIRHALLKRIRDKESMVRTQAVLGLGRLAGNESEGYANSEESDDEATGLLEKLLAVLRNDPSAEVRRSLLVSLPILPSTLPFLLERARDQDALTRRAVYSKLLPALGDFRHLSLSMREKLLRWGLRDRDENVRKAAGRIFRERWIEDCVSTAQQEAQEQEGAEISQSAVNFDALLELLERIDVINSGVENGVALEAMKGFWEGRADYRDSISMDDSFWETLSAESIFLARSFNSFCRTEGNGRYESLVEEKLPEVTKLAFYLERYLQALITALKSANLQEDDDEEETVEQEFIVEQMLHIVLTLDYSDEVGRRKMYTMLRQSISIPELPDEITKLCIEVLQHICSPDAAGEREFISIVLESVADVHDTILDDLPANNDDDSFHSARSEVSGLSGASGEKKGKPELSEEDARAKAVKEIVVNMKCLHIVQCMLTHVAGNLKDNADLVSMLNNLVVPAVRSHEAPVRERGLVCLGLCALLDRSLAEENLGLFIHFFTKGHTALQVTALHILTDILNIHGAQLLSSSPALLKVYIKAVKSGAKYPEVQAVAVVAASKLLLGRVVAEEEACEELLKSLVVAYFDPASASNQTVRQALNYFLPVYCYSRPENQDLMRRISVPALHSLFNLREGLDDDEIDIDEDMVNLSTIGACLVDWTDPRKCYTPNVVSDAEKKNVKGDVHLDFTVDVLQKLRGNTSREEKKLFAGLLSKLYISAGSTPSKLRETYEDVSDAVDEGLLSDATSKNALYKIHVSLGKIVNALEEEAEKGQRLGRDRRAATGETASELGEEEHSVKVEEGEEEEGGLEGDESEGTIVPKREDGDEQGEEEEEEDGQESRMEARDSDDNDDDDTMRDD